MSRPAGTERLLVTGSAGSIGRTLMRDLPSLGWDVRGFDRVPHAGGVVGDIGNPADLDDALAGVDALVHLAGQPMPAPWPVIRDANVEGLWQVFDAARRNGVRRVVWASSNHAVGYTPVAPDLPDDAPPRPDTLYGVSKAFGEALASYFVDAHGLQIACLRIGTFGERPTSARALATWLSPGDAVRLVDAALRAPDLTFAVVWGASANTRRTWSYAGGRALGFEPRDDAEQFACDVDAPLASDALVGGPFTDRGVE